MTATVTLHVPLREGRECDTDNEHSRKRQAMRLESELRVKTFAMHPAGSSSNFVLFFIGCVGVGVGVGGVVRVCGGVRVSV